MNIDNTSNAIIELLAIDGRRSNRSIARELRISESAVRERIKRLEASKAIRISLITDGELIGQSCEAYISIKALPKRVKKIAQAIAGYEAAQFVGLTLGEYEIMALIVGSSRGELIDFIDASILSLEGVISANVREPVAVLKHQYEFAYNV